MLIKGIVFKSLISILENQNMILENTQWIRHFILTYWNLHGLILRLERYNSKCFFQIRIYILILWIMFQFSSVTQSCLTLCDPMNRSTPGLPVHHQLPESTQTHVHQVGYAIQPCHPLSSPSPPAPNPSQHQGLFQRVNSSQEVAKVLQFQFQHQSFQCLISFNLIQLYW